jgi:hypothetical protein
VITLGTSAVDAIRYEQLHTFVGKQSMADLIALGLTPPVMIIVMSEAVVPLR